MTVKAPLLPAVVGDGKPATRNELAAAGVTRAPSKVPVMVPSAVSVAVTDWVPAVRRVTAKAWEPRSVAEKA
jgi:hypothetical protein